MEKQKKKQWKKNKEIGAAGLDVTTPEPLPTDHPLLKLQNVTVFPHIGSASYNTRNAMADLTVQNIIDALNGIPSKTVIQF